MKSAGGLSLVELLIVLGLMAILTGAMMPMVSSQLLKSTLNAQAEQLLFDLRLAQQYALAREDGYAYYGVRVFDNLDGGSRSGYKILRYEPATVTPPLAAAASVTVMKSGLDADDPVIVDKGLLFDRRVSFDPASSMRPRTGNDRVIFTPAGSSTADGLNLLFNVIVLRCGSFSRTISISPLTGNSELQ